jgi:hypothetical protein
MESLKRLEGQAMFDCEEEIWITEEESCYPDVRIFDGYIDTQTGFIRLFGSFDFEEKEHYIVIYIDRWVSDIFTEKDIETINDVLRIEWLYPVYDVYLPNEKEAFLNLLESFESKADSLT